MLKKNLIVLLKDLHKKKLFSKAIGLGMSKGINFKEIVIHNQSLESQVSKLKVKQKNYKKDFKKKILVFFSLSDDKPFAIALTIISI